mmetsp:Transcript_1704/g.3748  ORF Transcript_1704/g.3748 Transcript_1704/m.3748 type:complete len:155 (+) Transcript_1704:114-578(+)
MDNVERQLLEYREADPFYYYSIPGALKHDFVDDQDIAENMLRFLSDTEHHPVKRKTRVSCEIHPDEILLPILMLHEFGESQADRTGNQADVARMMAELLVEAEPARRRSTEPVRSSRGMQESSNNIGLKNRPRRNSFVCGDAPEALNTQVARGA